MLLFLVLRNGLFSRNGLVLIMGGVVSCVVCDLRCCVFIFDSLLCDDFSLRILVVEKFKIGMFLCCGGSGGIGWVLRKLLVLVVGFSGYEGLVI